ncbi:endolytic transglycosylase MltG [Cytobacillus depressus]|uniref:Endolytic transglycosylase MltG n=1 Tax=Cytobacillus depressus TaxID=1602942 RepID=A0A6L3VG60_9BACI|nr:endolytic transglycosylase MltG [Cytobacillus depressus]KAB2338524.1 endolytic transglycosylase MltG [Cytobacillus depressus]
MNRRNTRAFAFGILVSVSIIGSFYFSTKKDSAGELTIENAKALLTDGEYIVLTKEQYQVMEKAGIEATKQAEPPQQTPAAQKTDEIIPSLKLEIVSGMVSHDIAALLEREKIIDDGDHFETYLEENGYNKRIQLGTFDLKPDMSYKQIAKIITKS